MGDSILKAMELNKNHDSLYRGRSEEKLYRVAPYVFTCEGQEEFVKWLLESGWGMSWMILFESERMMSDVHRHFRKFLVVKTEEGKELYFRFYDPRVLKIFLPTCDNTQILEFFGPIRNFFVEGDTKDEVIQLWQENGLLRQKTMDFGKMLNEISG
jgi:hypothetical protein